MRQARRVQVALADCQPLFRDGVRWALESSGDFEVTGEVGDGEAAVDMVRALQPQLLLLDLALPGISGLEVLQHLHGGRLTTRTLLLAASIDRQQTLDALQLGARGVLTKNADVGLLLRAAHAVVKGEYWVGRQALADWTEYARQHREP